jgi:hypothetical protein
VRTLSLTSLLLLLFAAAATASITGTVIDETGKPIAGATVRAWVTEPSRVYRQRLISAQPENDPFATATTNDAGAFSIDAKGNIAVDLRIDKAERRSATREAVDGDEPLTVILRPPSRRKLRVESGGKAVANALVVFSAHQMARTSAAGEVPMLEDGAAWVLHPDFPPTRPFTSGPSPVVKLEKPVVLRGRVLNAKGAGVKADLFVGGMPAGSSGDDGAFTIARAPAKWSWIRAVAGKEAAQVSHTSASSIEIRLRPATFITGTLRDESAGRAVAGGRVTLRVLNAERDTFETAIADAKGRFAFDAMPSRGFSLFASHPAYSFEQVLIAAGENSDRVMVAHPMARLRGRVVDDARKPVAGASVSVIPGGSGVDALTDASGNFSTRIAILRNQVMFVNATKRGYASGSTPARRLKEGETLNDIIVTLPVGFPLQVRVIDGKRQPVTGVMVFVNEEDETFRSMAACEDPWQEDCHTTDAKGQVTLRVTEGQYGVSVMAPAGSDSVIAPKRIAAQQITPKTSPLVIQVENGVAINGKVAYSDGTLVPDVTIDLRGGSGMGNRPEPSADGTFSITGLAPGKYTLTATTGDGHIATPPVEVTAPAANVVLTMPRGGRIEGRVVERGTLRPIADFVVAPTGPRQMFRSPGERETHSEDGAFVIENVPPGNTTIRVTARGYVPGTRADIQVEDGRTVNGIDVQLERGAKLTGRVTAEGKPLAGVGVRVVSLSSPMAGGPNAGSTDADGQYTIEGIPAGEPAFEFRKQGYVSKRQNVEITAAKEAHLDVELERGRDLRGRVADKAGTAIEGASVSAFPSQGGESIQAVTTADGSFVLEGLGESRYNLQVRKSGYVSASEREVVLPQAAPLTITLDRGGVVSGRVTGLTPNELGACRVSVGGQGSYASATVDASGAFTVRGVPDGQLTAQATVSGTDRRSKMKPFVMENGSAPLLEINFEEGFTLRGHVTFNGAPAASGYINFRQREVAQPGISARVFSGTYEVTGFSAGDYDVIVSTPEGGYRGKYTVTGSATYDIDVRGATLRGRVVDAGSSAPVADASISVAGKGATAFSNATSDSEGRFSVPALLDGTYTLSVRRETYSPFSQPVEIAGGVAADLEVRLEGGTPATIIVTDATTGTSLANANVMIDSSGKRIAGGLARGDDGTRVWLAPGRYTAMANAFGYQSGNADFSVPGPTVRIALARAGSLVIIAKSAGMARLRGAGVLRGMPFSPGTNTPMESIPPGQYTLEVLDSKKTVIKSVPVTIVPGEKTTVTLD